MSEQGSLLAILDGIGSLLARGGTLVASASPEAATFTIWDLGRVPRAGASATFLDRTGLTAVSHQGAYLYYPRVGDKRKVTVWDVAAGAWNTWVHSENQGSCLPASWMVGWHGAPLTLGPAHRCPRRTP